MIEIFTYVFTSPDYEPIDKLSRPPPDADYIKGMIELTIDGVKIITRNEWDLVDQLWAYMVNGIVDVAAGRSFNTHFPDQPIELRFDLVEPDEVSIELRYPGLRRPARAQVRRREWINAVATEATRVLLAIGALVPENRESYQPVIDQAAELLRSAGE